jgi:hypothetical protein
VGFSQDKRVNVEELFPTGKPLPKDEQFEFTDVTYL